VYKSQKRMLAAISDPEVSRQYQEQLDQFAKKIKKSRQELSEHQALLAPLQAKLGQDALPLETKREILEQILTIEPGDMNLLAELVFYCAMNEEWTKALEYARRFRDLEGRENANRLRVGLLAGEILLNMDRKKEAMTALQNYKTDTKDGWYRLISDSLLSEKKEKSLMEKAGESPEYMLTGHVARAFWAEGSGDNNKAIDHYREALGSYMDDMIEYVFAVERINRLRQKSK
jgi:predicted Zn-dependent protease